MNRALVMTALWIVMLGILTTAAFIANGFTVMVALLVPLVTRWMYRGGVMINGILLSFFFIFAIDFLIGVVMLIVDDGWSTNEDLTMKIMDKLFLFNTAVAIVASAIIFSSGISIKTIVEVSK